MSKAAAQRKHAKRRAFERLGLDVGQRTLDAMVSDIQSGNAKFLRRQSLRITVWKVECQERPCAAVYDKDRKTIVTVMPLEWENVAATDHEPAVES
jgi:hypothetical protein